MSRTLPASIQTAVDTALGSSPRPAIKVEWTGGTKWYAYSDETVEAVAAEGKLLSFNVVSYSGKQDKIGQVSSVSVTIDDTDLDLHAKLCTEALQGVKALVKLYYGATDTVTLTKGKVSNDVTWSEADRTLTFTIDSFEHENEVGYSPVDGDFADLHPDAIGNAWPLCFGSVLRVPAQRVVKPTLGSLANKISNLDTTFIINNGTQFPQNQSIAIDIGNISMQGNMTGNTFTPTQTNVSQIPVPVALGARVADADVANPNVFWVANFVDLQNRHVLVTHSSTQYTNKVLSQIGNKVTVANNFPGALLLDATSTLDGATVVALSAWFADPTIQHSINRTATQSDVLWEIESGATVKYWRTSNEFNVYVANLIDSTVTQVIGSRSTPNGVEFSLIPSTYYSILTVGAATTLLGKACTAIKFIKPLEDYDGEAWTGDVFVSLRSTEPDDTAPASNTSKIIQYLLETYSGLSIDTTSFDAVAAKIATYPSHFALFQQQEVIPLVENIAWQARCALFIENDTAFLRYLSEEPTAATFINETEVLQKTLTFRTEDSELYTRMESKWQHNYDGTSDHEYIAKNNVSTHGLHSIAKDFYIYNIESLVEISTDFWLYRYSNVWRRASCELFQSNYHLQMFDAAEWSLTLLGVNSIKGVIEEIRFDVTQPNVLIDCELASNDGTCVENPLYWTAGIVAPNHVTPDDPLADIVIPPNIVPSTTGGGGSDDVTDQTDNDDLMWLVWSCYPQFCVTGKAFAYKIGVYDRPNINAGDVPIKIAAKVRIDPVFLQNRTIIPQQMNSAYVDVVDGEKAGTFTVDGHVPTGTMHIWARAVTHDLGGKNALGVPDGSFRDTGRDRRFRSGKTGDIIVIQPDEEPDALSVVVPATVQRDTPFNIVVDASVFNVELEFRIKFATDAKEALATVGGNATGQADGDAPLTQWLPRNKATTLRAKFIGGSGTDKAKIEVTYAASECDPEEKVVLLSPEITITANVNDPPPQSSDPTNPDYDPPYDPDVNPGQLRDLVKIRYNKDDSRRLEYTQRQLRIGPDNKIQGFTDFKHQKDDDWTPILTSEPCPDP
jgi:hypothetical protein